MTAAAPPPNEELVNQAGNRLESWKEIAAYLKRGVRTVQRWEQTEGLPVYRHVHDKRSTVYAWRQEIDAWREKRTERTAQAAAAGRPETASGSSGKPSIGGRVAAAFRRLLPPHQRKRLAVRAVTLIVLSLAAAGV
jgi:hypothetical protein